jgi:hypothetical protein
MKFRDYKIWLLNHDLFKRFDEYDLNLFKRGIADNKPFNNMSYFIDKYKLTTEEFNAIHKYTVLINNWFKDDYDV